MLWVKLLYDCSPFKDATSGDHSVAAPLWWLDIVSNISNSIYCKSIQKLPFPVNSKSISSVLLFLGVLQFLVTLLDVEA